MNGAFQAAGQAVYAAQAATPADAPPADGAAPAGDGKKEEVVEEADFEIVDDKKA